MKLVALILCVLSCIGLGILIIPLFWCIPLTMKVYRAYKGTDFLETKDKVLILIFVNLLGGLLLLIDSDY